MGACANGARVPVLAQWMLMVVEPQSLQSLSAEELRELTTRLMTQLQHQKALWKRRKSAAQSELFNPEQKSLLEDEIEADLAAVATEIDALQEAQAPAKLEEKRSPKRAPLPANLPRREIRHEPDSTACASGCRKKGLGEGVDYVPGVFTVERHIRGKWACAKCETLTQAPVDPHIIDKGIPTTGLLAQVLVAKYADHLPLYRQEAIFGRAGLAIPRSTLAQWVGSCGVQLRPLVEAMKAELLQHRVLHADETPVSMLKPGNGKTHRAYLWAYATGAFENTKVVVYDFCESRSGEQARRFLGDWRCSLTCDDFSGYKTFISRGGTQVGCLAHARRKFFDLHAANQSQIAEFALQQFGRIYEIEHEVKELATDQRQAIRQQQTKPLLDALHQWMVLQRQKVPEGSASAKALDYSLRRWVALTRFVDD